MKHEIIPATRIAPSIYFLRGQKVMLDSDLAALYGVPTGHLNRAVKRNGGRFPADFMFRLNAAEENDLKCQIGISNTDLRLKSRFVISKPGRGGRRHQPHAFTEQGVAMLSSVLKSERAVKVNIAIMRAFVQLRESLETNRELARKFSELEKRVGERTRLACWRWRPRHRELFLSRERSARGPRVRRSFSARRRKQHARRVRSPTLTT
jgi:hypothetical protein